MVDHCHIPADKITVIYPGIRELFFSSPKQDEAIIKKYSLTKNNYIMTIGFMDPRKNLIAQIKAFEELILRKKDLPDSFKIVITGPESGLSVEINELLKRATLKNRVVLTGYLEDQILLTLLDHCNFLSYCSLYEGFGLPVIEAMARKIPVVTSDNSSLYEIAKDHAHICSATSTDSMTSAYIECLEENFDKKEKRILAAHQYAQDFTEENWCLKHFQLFRNKA
jgi:glycosyltransferase involved in cell wall biosynthesis